MLKNVLWRFIVLLFYLIDEEITGTFNEKKLQKKPRKNSE